MRNWLQDPQFKQFVNRLKNLAELIIMIWALAHFLGRESAVTVWHVANFLSTVMVVVNLSEIKGMSSANPYREQRLITSFMSILRLAAFYFGGYLSLGNTSYEVWLGTLTFCALYLILPLITD